MTGRQTRLLVAALITVWLAGCGAGAGDTHDSSVADATGHSAQPSVLVQTAPLRRGSLSQTLSAYGTVQPAPSAHLSIAAPVAAQVDAVYVHRGDVVAAGAALVRLQPSPPTQAEYAQALSAVQLASESVRRTRQLLDELLATQQQLAEAQKAESDARAALAALQVQGAGAASTLRAPSAAIVTEVSASVRALVSEGAPLLELARPSGLLLTVGVAPDVARQIVAGDSVRVTAIGETDGYPATVLSRGALVESDTGLVPVQIAVPAGRLLPGQAAEAVITIGTVAGFVVPHVAVLIDDNGDPYVVQAVAGVAQIVPVRVLATRGDQETVSGSLDINAPLVLAGNYQARDGMKLRLPAAR